MTRGCCDLIVENGMIVEPVKWKETVLTQPVMVDVLLTDFRQ